MVLSSSLTTKINETTDASRLAKHGLQRGPDGLITWRQGSEDHPRNWPTERKAFDTTFIIFLEFFVTVVSTTGASVAHHARHEYGLDKAPSILAFTFMYNLGQAFGGLLTPALSELIGRRTPYLVSSAVFTVFCLLVGVVQHPSAVWVGRFVTGFASAVPAVVTAGSIEDMFDGRQRVWLVVLWNAGSTAGLCLGPIYGAYIMSVLNWRWVFYISAIITGCCFLALLFVKESRPSRILKRKIATLEAEGMEHVEWFNPDDSPDLRSLIRLAVLQPLKLLGTEPIVMMVTTLQAVSWGIIYLFTECLPDVFMSFSVGFDFTTSSLAFLAFLPGICLSFLPRLWDSKIVHARLANDETIEPEDKIMGLVLAAPALAVGLMWFSWTIPPAIRDIHWLVPTCALVLVGFAVNEMAYTLSAYLTDAYLLYAASAFCGLAFIRALVSGLMPFVAQEMYPALGANYAGTVVGAFAVVFCLAPWLSLKYGKALREKSPFAKHSLESHLKSQGSEQSNVGNL